MKAKKTWGIIGLGWLGQALADELKLQSDDVWGTHRKSFSFGLNDFPSTTCDILFLNTPPILDLSPKQFTDQVQLQSNSKLIFISSTSVYGPSQLNCTEEVLPQPWTANGKWLYEVEGLLNQKFKASCVVLRPGGLIGGERHPVFYFSKSRQISGGLDPVNLIHRMDLINIIIKVADLNLSGVMNLVAPFHPTKNDYYNGWCKKLNLPPIQFEMNGTPSKKVDSIHLGNIYKNWICPNLDHL